MIASITYAACAVTSAACSILLARGYARRRIRLLLWGALCFLGLAVNNLLLFVDVVMIPARDLSLWRGATGLAALLALLHGLVADSR